jgi:hypothetical protein
LGHDASIMRKLHILSAESAQSDFFSVGTHARTMEFNRMPAAGQFQGMPRALCF